MQMRASVWALAAAATTVASFVPPMAKQSVRRRTRTVFASAPAPPHSGYHGNGVQGRFFEGWFLVRARSCLPPRLASPLEHKPALLQRVTTDETSLAFIYHIMDPTGTTKPGLR